MILFPFGIEDGMWDVIVLIPDHCLSIYFESIPVNNEFLCISHPGVDEAGDIS